MQCFFRTSLMLVTFAAFWCSNTAIAAYDYPIHNRFDATIIGTPEEFAAQLPRTIPLKTYKLPALKNTPAVFWHQNGLGFSAALQKKRAPLIFLIAGTGASYDSSKMLVIQKALYGAGFSVVGISSPTHFNFIVNASTTGLAGYLPDDTLDLYRVMQQAWNMIRDDAKVSEFSVAGYSLGGTNAAFIAQHDEQARSFNFKHVLMINPAVDLYNSVKLLDSYLTDNIKQSQGATFLDEAIQDIAVAYDPKEGMDFDNDIFYRAYKMKGSNKHASLLDGGDHESAALIGLTFRISSSGMLFAGDVMSKSGYIAPANKVFGRTDVLDYYAWASAQVPFAQYVDALLIPALMKKHPGTSREQLLHNASLLSIEDYLRHSKKIYAVTNADEIILAPDEIEYLRSTMGSRLHVYPYGGHCGNMGYRDNVQKMLAVFKGEGV